MPDVALHPSSTAALLVVFAGLPGAGKSTLARLVAQQRDAVWLRVDTVEASLLKAGIPQSFETGLAAYLAVRDVAAEHLRLGRDVVVDAVNGVEAAREMWRTLATESQAVLSFVMVTCSDPDEHRRRVEARADPTPPLPSPSWAEVVDREFVPWGDPVLRVD
ncbi:MAG: AAA family ATPase, partial [Thermoplasmata archaeon]